MKTITLQKAIKLIRATKGTVFSTTFIKRTDGSIRTLVGRLEVTKGVNGKGMAFDPFDKGLIPVYDFQKQAFRMINCDTIQRISVRGKEYQVK